MPACSLKRSLALVLLAAAVGSHQPPPPLVHGTVVTDGGPVAGACVRWQATAVHTQTNAEGRFQLPQAGQRLTAWKEGFFIAGTAATGLGPFTLRLKPLPQEDDDNYNWVDPRPGRGSHRCANCHQEIFAEWQVSAHARSASGLRLLGLYAGIDVNGQQAGWGLLRDQPLGASVCAACHAPTVSLSAPGYEDLRAAQGVSQLGVHCDFCHKIVDAPLAKLGTAHGRFGYRLLRPRHGQVFFGPLDDVDRGEESFLPLYRQSRYCALCHEGTVFGAPAYTTYSEWQVSPAGQQGKTCQSCHMTPTGQMTNFAPDHGGVERNPLTLASHHTPGGSAEMLKRCLQVSTQLNSDGNQLRLQVDVQARPDAVGHQVPTGFPDRHLILFVQASDAQGRMVPASLGPSLTTSAGDDALTGRPGFLFAKQFSDEAGQQPIPFWRYHRLVRDTRLTPGQPQHFTWHFPANRVRNLSVTLLYRRFWKVDADRKGWSEIETVLYRHSPAAP